MFFKSVSCGFNRLFDELGIFFLIFSDKILCVVRNYVQLLCFSIKIHHNHTFCLILLKFRKKCGANDIKGQLQFETLESPDSIQTSAQHFNILDKNKCG